MSDFVRVKSLFFDRQKVIDAVDKATRRNLSRIGAFLRTRARSSMRKRKKPAAQGKPPSVHEGHLKDWLFFSYEPSKKSVVVGPAKFKLGVVPHLLEFGGTQTIRRGSTSRQARYRGNPYMKPALDAEIKAGTVPKVWKDSVRSS